MEQFSVTDVWADYEISFASPFTSSNASLYLFLGQDSSAIEFENLSLTMEGVEQLPIASPEKATSKENGEAPRARGPASD